MRLAIITSSIKKKTVTQFFLDKVLCFENRHCRTKADTAAAIRDGPRRRLQHTHFARRWDLPRLVAATGCCSPGSRTASGARCRRWINDRLANSGEQRNQNLYNIDTPVIENANLVVGERGGTSLFGQSDGAPPRNIYIDKLKSNNAKMWNGNADASMWHQHYILIAVRRRPRRSRFAFNHSDGSGGR